MALGVAMIALATAPAIAAAAEPVPAGGNTATPGVAANGPVAGATPPVVSLPGESGPESSAAIPASPAASNPTVPGSTVPGSTVPGGALTAGSGASDPAAPKPGTPSPGNPVSIVPFVAAVPAPDPAVASVTTIGPILPDAKAVASSGTAGGAAIAFAMAQRGLPYVWGGNGPAAGDSGFDCSGLTTAAFSYAGISLPRTAHTQFYAGPHVPAAAPLEPGDLVFYGTPARVHHVGLYIGDARMVNAPTFGRPVQVAFVRYPGDDYIGATRPAAGINASGLLSTFELPYRVPMTPAPTTPRGPADFLAPAAPYAGPAVTLLPVQTLAAVLPDAVAPVPPVTEGAGQVVVEPATAPATQRPVVVPTTTPAPSSDTPDSAATAGPSTPSPATGSTATETAGPTAPGATAPLPDPVSAVPGPPAGTDPAPAVPGPPAGTDPAPAVPGPPAGTDPGSAQSGPPPAAADPALPGAPTPAPPVVATTPPPPPAVPGPTGPTPPQSGPSEAALPPAPPSVDSPPVVAPSVANPPSVPRPPAVAAVAPHGRGEVAHVRSVRYQATPGHGPQGRADPEGTGRRAAHAEGRRRRPGRAPCGGATTGRRPPDPQGDTDPQAGADRQAGADPQSGEADLDHGQAGTVIGQLGLRRRRRRGQLGLLIIALRREQQGCCRAERDGSLVALALSPEPGFGAESVSAGSTAARRTRRCADPGRRGVFPGSSDTAARPGRCGA